MAARKPDAPWSRSFSVFLKLGLVVIAIRLVFQVALGSPVGEHVLFSLPVVPLPEWMASLRLGGDITAESIIFAACDGLRLAVLLACVGAANSPATPTGLVGARTPAGIELRWDPSPDADVAGYNLYRLRPNGAGDRVTPNSCEIKKLNSGIVHLNR